MKTILLFFITLWNVTVIFSQNEIIGEELSIPSKKMDVKGTFLIPQNFSKRENSNTYTGFWPNRQKWKPTRLYK